MNRGTKTPYTVLPIVLFFMNILIAAYYLVYFPHHSPPEERVYATWMGASFLFFAVLMVTPYREL